MRCPGFGEDGVMKFLPAKLLLFVCLMLAVSDAGMAKDGEARKALQDAEAFAEAGDFAKALERHQWYHDNALRVDPAQYGVRLSFALGSWKELADKYPPALAALKATRKKAADALLKGTAKPEVFHEVQSIDQVIEDPAATVALFKKLEKQQPGLAEKCFRFAKETLLAEGEGETFLRHAGDPVEFLKGEIADHDRNVAEMKKRKMPRQQGVIAHFDDNLVKATLQLAAVLEKRGDVKTAAELKAMTAKSVDDARLKP